MRVDMSGDYVLKNDITFLGLGTNGFPTEGFATIGQKFNTQFLGSFDGESRTITNFYINQSLEHVGLFGFVTNKTFKDLYFENPNVMGSGQVAVFL